MSPLPTQMANHWWQRPGRRPGRAQYHWHMLFHDQPKVHDLTAKAQRKLAGLPGLDMVPLRWLHLTTLVLGFADEVPSSSLAAMTATARQVLADVAPIGVRLGRVFYHPEPVGLAVEPIDALRRCSRLSGLLPSRPAVTAMPTPTRGSRTSRSPTATAAGPRLP